MTLNRREMIFVFPELKNPLTFWRSQLLIWVRSCIPNMSAGFLYTTRLLLSSIAVEMILQRVHWSPAEI